MEPVPMSELRRCSLVVVVDEAAEHDTLNRLREFARSLAKLGVDEDPSVFAEPYPLSHGDGASTTRPS